MRISILAVYVMSWLAGSAALAQAIATPNIGDSIILAQSVEPNTADETDVVTITIAGVDQVPAELAVAVTELAAAINTLREVGINLSPEQLSEIDRILATLSTLVATTGENADQIDSAIRNAEQPLTELTQALLTRVDQAFVSPALMRTEATIDKLDRVTRTVRNTVFASLMVLIALIIGVLVWTGRQLTAFYETARQISDAYVIVPRADWDGRSAADSAVDEAVATF
ncbi:MAG: hypothetical protein AAFO81_00700 [Pseudomonadota bacterium]